MIGECAKMLAVGLIVMGGVSGGFDAARAQSMTEILECREIAAELDRLACFDRTTGMAAEAAPTAALEQEASRDLQAVAQASPQTPLSGDNSFGAEDLIKTQRSKDDKKDASSKSLRAKLISLGFTNSGKYVITLDNGQVWRQIQGDTARLSLPSIDGNGIPIIIRKGALGSHRLRTLSSKRTIRVERLQ